MLLGLLKSDSFRKEKKLYSLVPHAIFQLQTFQHISQPNTGWTHGVPPLVGAYAIDLHISAVVPMAGRDHQRNETAEWTMGGDGICYSESVSLFLLESLYPY